RVLAGLAAKQLEVMGVQREVLGADPVAVHDGRQPSLTAEAGDFLARDLARLGGEIWATGRCSGHREDLGLSSSGTGAARQRVRVWGARKRH
ncbi:MAG: hypothetical protein QOI09_1697, partial [Chloroflexota bacterium]|nr:hypothetical protein [Chloroflexota bacterium]